MKNSLVFVLLTALVVSLAISVSAAPGDPAEMELYPVPFLLSCSCDELSIYSTEELDQLEAASQEIFREAEDRLPDAVPGEMSERDFFYVDMCEDCQESTADFRVENFDRLLVKQYVDHQWVSVEFTVNGDGTISVYGLVDGPVVFVVGRLIDVTEEPTEEPTVPKSAEADAEDLAPIVVDASCDQIMVYTTETVELLHHEEQKLLEKAKEMLPEAVPEGMAVRYLFYVDICEECNESVVEFELDAYEDLVIKQFVGEKWVELKFTVNPGGTITVDDVVDGPLAIFVKVTD